MGAFVYFHHREDFLRIQISENLLHDLSIIAKTFARSNNICNRVSTTEKTGNFLFCLENQRILRNFLFPNRISGTFFQTFYLYFVTGSQLIDKVFYIFKKSFLISSSFNLF